MSATNIQKRYSVKKIGAFNVLHINDQAASCAYRMPAMLPHPTIQGQIQIHTPVCGDNCQFFNLKEHIKLTEANDHELVTECNKTTFKLVSPVTGINNPDKT